MTRAIVIGAGPAGLGPLLCAMQRGVDGELLSRGVTWLEGSARVGCGALGAWGIDSDTRAEVLLESVERSPALRDLLTHERAQCVERHRGGSIPLRDAAAFLEVVGTRLASHMLGTPSAVHTETVAERVIHEKDGSYTVLARTKQGPRSFHAETVVYAMGGRAITASLELRAPALTAATLFGTDGRAHLHAQLPERPTIAIVGGSHSAFAAATIVLEELGARLAPGALQILTRRRPKLFYPSLAEAHADGYTEATEQDVCPETGRVHRLGGLRLGSRELLRRVWGLGDAAPEPRVQVVPYAIDSLPRFDRVITALGFDANTVPYYRGDQRVALHAERGERARLVDHACRLLDADAQALPDAWGIGLASGYVPRGEPSFRGQTNGIWLYQNDTGALLLDALLR